MTPLYFVPFLLKQLYMALVHRDEFIIRPLLTR